MKMELTSLKRNTQNFHTFAGVSGIPQKSNLYLHTHAGMTGISQRRNSKFCAQVELVFYSEISQWCKKLQWAPLILSWCFIQAYKKIQRENCLLCWEMHVGMIWVDHSTKMLMSWEKICLYDSLISRTKVEQISMRMDMKWWSVDQK